MSKTWKAFQTTRPYQWILLFVFLFVGFTETAHKAVPASLWYELRSVHIQDGPSIDDLMLIIDRNVHKAFTGHYTVRVWPEDMTAPICTASDHGPYRPTAPGLLRKPFSWWAANQRPPCATQVAVGGRYLAETCVYVEPTGFFFRNFPPDPECVWSNVFAITPLGA